MSVLDAYRVLGLEPDADAEQAERAYRRLIRVNHPDVGGDTSAAAAINDAYTTVREWIASRPQPEARTVEAAPDIGDEPTDNRSNRRVLLAEVVLASALDLVLMRLDFAVSKFRIMLRLLITPTHSSRQHARLEAQAQFEDKWWSRYGDRWDTYGPLSLHGRRGVLDYPRARLFASLRF